jgi:hypothetical protein
MNAENQNIKTKKESAFDYELKELRHITLMLRKYGGILVVILIMQIIILAGFLVFSRFCYKCNFGVHNEFTLIVLLFSISALLMGVFLLFRFSRLKNRGMIIYEEITEEIDWSFKRKEFIHKPPIELRILIKDFLKSSDLPFTSGNFGQAFYFLIFILVTISTLVLIGTSQY